MKTSFSKIILSFVLILTLAVFAIPSASVSADPGDTPQSAEQVQTRLEQWFAREKEIQIKQEARLVKAEEVIAKVSEYIASEQAAGYDTSSLEAALANFESAFADNAVLSAAAAELIAAHAGFDADGKVTEIQIARQTVKSIGQNQRQFHLAAVQATTDLRAALKAYRELNHPKTTKQQP